MPRRKKHKIHEPEFKISILRLLVFLVFGIIVMRLFFLQVIKHDHFQAVAAREHYGYTELPARRGEIFIKDYASGEDIRVATNVTLDTLYADPTLIENPKLVAIWLYLEAKRQTNTLMYDQHLGILQKWRGNRLPNEMKDWLLDR